MKQPTIPVWLKVKDRVELARMTDKAIEALVGDDADKDLDLKLFLIQDMVYMMQRMEMLSGGGN